MELASLTWITVWIPAVIAIGLCIVVLKFGRNPVSLKGGLEPESHFAGGVSEIGIFASNVSSTFGIGAFWLLFMQSFVSWGWPSFLCAVGGILISHAIYFFVATTQDQSNRHRTLVHWLLKRNDGGKIAAYFLLLIASGLVVLEFAMFRLIVTELLTRNGHSIVHAFLITFVVGLFCIVFAYWGGLRAVIRTDLILLFFAVFIALFYIMNFSDFKLDTSVVKQNFSQADSSGLNMTEPFTTNMPTIWGIVKRDWSVVHFGNKSPLNRFRSILNYFSAFLGVVCLYLAMPDYWLRNIVVENKRRRRHYTILASAFANVALITLCHVIAISSRTIETWNNLSPNEFPKAFDLAHLTNYLSSSGSDFVFLSTIFVLIVSMLTSVDALLISSVSVGHYFGVNYGRAEQPEGTSGNYNALLFDGFDVTIVILFISMLLTVGSATSIGLFVGSSMVPLIFVLSFSRIRKWNSVLTSRRLLISVMVSIGLYFTIAKVELSQYYPLAALAASFVAMFIPTFKSERSGQK